MEFAAASPRDPAGLIQLLLSYQSDSGAFASSVSKDSNWVEDYNGFVTALILRELEPLAGLPDLIEPCRVALDFLEECEAPARSGFFAFWPRCRWPSWAPPVPEDSDCTATIASELMHYGRIDLNRAREIALTALTPYRLRNLVTSINKPWIRPGVFLTWQHHGCHPNPIDCVVNVNVAGFLAQIGLQHQSGYDEASQMVCDAIRSTGGQRDGLEQLSPYYPEPAELVIALRNAVRRGAVELRGCLEELEGCEALKRQRDPGETLFSMADRRTRWSSHALWAARELSAQHCFS